MLDSPQPETALSVLKLFVLFQLLGLGPALVLARWCRLPARFIGPLVSASATAASYCVFWVSVTAPAARSFVAVGAVAASGLLAAWLLAHPEMRRRLLAREAWIGPLLGLVFTAAYLALLFWTGVISNYRFTRDLPGDNLIPVLFADRVVSAAPLPSPPPPLWPNGDRASERPPLQAAVMVALSPFSTESSAEHQIIGTICQTPWVSALLLLAGSCGLSRRQTAFVIIAAAYSGFFFLNSVYTWPKLLSAWLFLSGLAMLIELESASGTPAHRRLSVAGALFTLSFLAHGGTAFSIAALPILLVAKPGRQWRDPRGLAAALAVSGLLLAPWMVYQRVVDPPENRLLKIHLAGTEERSDRDVLPTIVAAYREHPGRDHVLARWENLRAQFSQPDGLLWRDPVAWAQRDQFFHHMSTLDVLAAGLILLLATCARERRPRPHAMLCALALHVVASLLVWVLITFRPGSAVIHHGSYANTALLLFLGAIGLTLFSWRIAYGLLALHVAIFAAVWLSPRAAPGREALSVVSTGEGLAGVLLLVAGLASLLLLPPAWEPTGSSQDGRNHNRT